MAGDTVTPESLDRYAPMGMPLPWSVAISGYLWDMLALGTAPSSLDLRRYQLGRVARMVGARDPWAVTSADLVSWAGSVTHWAANTRRSYRTTIRGFYAWALEAGHVASSPATALPRVRPAPPNPRPAPDKVYRPALAAASTRERLMLRLAAEHGLRRGEIAVVHTRDLLDDLTGWSLVVHGKGNKDRLVPLLDDLAAEMRRLPEGWAFPGRVDGHLSPRWVGRLVTRLLEGDWTTHKLRHRAATAWWEASGHDVLTVGELLGHADPKTTRLYVKVSDRRLRDVVRRGAA